MHALIIGASSFRKKLQVESYIEPISRAVVLVVEESISVSQF